MTSSTTQRSCLIVERNNWETGGAQQQLQIPLMVAEMFFGPGNTRRRITIRLFLSVHSTVPALTKNITVSRTYQNGTRRINGFDEIGSIPSCFIFFEETTDSGVYDVWWNEDKAIVAARYDHWEQGQNSQHGRGRLAIIVPSPVERNLLHV